MATETPWLDVMRSRSVKASGDRTMVQAWEYANVYSRNSTFILSMAAALGLNSQQVDDLFIAAAQVV